MVAIFVDEMISDWLRDAILMVGFLWGALIGQCQKWCPDDRIQQACEVSDF